MIDPLRPPPTQDMQKRLEKQRIQNFHEKHPLAKMHKAFQYLLWRRAEGDWERADTWADALVRGFANLPTAQQQSFEDVLPGHPDAVRASTSAWCLYLGFLLASRERRESLAVALDKAVVEGWGPEYIPNVYRSDEVPSS